MPAVPLISIQGPSSASTVSRGTVQKAKWLGGGPALSMACWEVGSLHKEFPNKRHQYYLCSHQTPGAQYALAQPQALSTFCVKAWWGLSRHILALNGSTLEGLPPPPIFALQALLGLSLSKLDNGWTLTGSGSVQRRGLTEGKWLDGRTIEHRWHCWDWIPDKFTGRLSSDNNLIWWSTVGVFCQALAQITHFPFPHNL